MLLKETFDDNIMKQIYNSDRLKRYSLFIIGVLIQASAFNIFILPSNMSFGVSGISVVLKQLLGLNPAYIILIANLLLLIASLVYLGKEATSKTIAGALLYPLLIEATIFLPSVIDLGDTEPVIVALSGAVLYGFGTGLVFKAGYTTGGTDVLKQIISQYGKKSLGQATIYIEGFIVTACLFVFGWQAFIYSIISLYIISTLTDKVILGISKYKTFQIITEKEKEVKHFILNGLHHGVTILDSKGGFTGEKKKILLCTIPTKQYFILKEGIMQIDKKAFFIVTDTYEVRGGE
ncbi:MAG: YitT family protein [Coprobacillus sp.]|nr:YitT family protein [Coprobacillus sp.]MCI9084298.1 YitT family protein [Bacilli bacterium]MCI9586147.1 YitT family protein [Bacilli bacterium]